jgi:hypothetical protein
MHGGAPGSGAPRGNKNPLKHDERFCLTAGIEDIEQML